MPRPARNRPSGEFEFLAKVRSAVEALGPGPGVDVGIGDDCAVLRAPSWARRHLLTTDTVVEGVHFEAGWLTPRELGRRAFRAAVSDFSAMGGRPLWVLLSLELPAHAAQRAALALVRAVAAEARACGATLVGGNVSAGPRLSVTTTIHGACAGRPLLRSGARRGDVVMVTGALGGAAAGWRALASSMPRARARTASAAYRLPPLRLELGQALASGRLAHAAIDVSDGLLQDLGHVAEQSGVRVQLDASLVPVHRAAIARAAAGGVVDGERSRLLALAGGEDYELAFTVPARHVAAIQALARRCGTTATVIGRVLAGVSDRT